MTVSGKTDLLLIFNYQAFYTENSLESDLVFTSLYVSILTLSPSQVPCQDKSHLLSSRLVYGGRVLDHTGRTGCFLESLVRRRLCCVFYLLISPKEDRLPHDRE